MVRIPKQRWQTDRQTDRRADGRTDRHCLEESDQERQTNIGKQRDSKRRTQWQTVRRISDRTFPYIFFPSNIPPTHCTSTNFVTYLLQLCLLHSIPTQVYVIDLYLKQVAQVIPMRLLKTTNLNSTPCR